MPRERCYTDAAQAFAENEADFVVIVVPPAGHERIVELAIAHGCHILSEKPIADTMEAAARIYHNVRRSGLKMAITMSHRFDQDKQTLERLVRTGQYGPLSHLACRLLLNYRREGDWGSFRHHIGDPLLVEAAVHQFDTMRALAGANARTVYANTWNPAWGEYEGDSNGIVVVEMENGVRAVYEASLTTASTLNPWDEEYWRAECRDGTLELDRRRLRVLSGGPGDQPLVEEVALDERPAWTNSWLAEWFVDWISGGDPPPTTLEDNIQCQALTMAAVESAHSGQVVDIRAYLERHLSAAESDPPVSWAAVETQ